MSTSAMTNPASADWNLGISRSDVEKLIRGFRPAAMEDRWICRADPPEARGDFVVCISRSWTRAEVFRLNVVLATGIPDGGAASDEPHARITGITWDRGEGAFLDTEQKAKDLAARICRGLMGCEV